MHDPLQLPDILAVIFGLLDASSNASNALVCKRWSDIALDELWRELDDLEPLMRILAWDEEQNDYGVPTTAQWARYAIYSSRVRHLNLSDDRTDFETDFWGCLNRVSIHRPTLAMLPQLRHYQWNLSDRRFAPLFFNSTVTTFNFVVEEVDEDMDEYSDKILAQIVVARMPAIINLHLWWPASYEPDATLVPMLLDGFPGLREIHLPLRAYTSDTYLRLSKLQYLRVIDFQGSVEDSVVDPGPSEAGAEEYRPLELSHDAFPALSKLVLYLDPPQAATFIQQDHFPIEQLQSLFIYSKHAVAPRTLPAFLDLLKTKCRSLGKLVMMLSGNTKKTLLGLDTEPDLLASFTLDTFRPILSYQELAQLSVYNCAQPLDITDEEVVEIVRSLPRLKGLDLNCAPLHLSRPKLTLSSLALLSTHCPQLSYLSLYADLDAPLSPFAQSCSASFVALEKLCMGPAPLKKMSVRPAAIMLSRILRGFTEMFMGHDIRSFTEYSVSKWDIPQDRLDNWDEVAAAVELMVMARKDERRTLG
ncbi:hypothetical protein BV25DRAFT_1825869 [Artomyces pyxidatus]|uniref:Uncharacterized protein n=1 Tax=Artomyces pyxidatus TaxID=48021 RepID=A0ACB8T0M3_9AGAM|nr:hypothetical protein BV25DRAFT_1825869 [Artomyces pyxidatus]